LVVPTANSSWQRHVLVIPNKWSIKNHSIIRFALTANHKLASQVPKPFRLRLVMGEFPGQFQLGIGADLALSDRPAHRSFSVGGGESNGLQTVFLGTMINEQGDERPKV
jgi:hypothetical protein